MKTSPTMANVPYGEHEKQVLDFWQAKSEKPAPLVFFIHGGSWRTNDKDIVTAVRDYLAAGISVVSINYRFTQEAKAAGIKPPVQWPLHDAARALQFVRSKAGEWNIDKTRIAASGGSAGACTSLWLAFHDDLADPNSKEYSPYELVTSDDPPVYLFYSMPPAIGKDQKDPTHSSNFGVKLQEKMRAIGVECHVMYPGATNLPQPNPVKFLIARLKTEKIKSDVNNR